MYYFVKTSIISKKNFKSVTILRAVVSFIASEFNSTETHRSPATAFTRELLGLSGSGKLRFDLPKSATEESVRRSIYKLEKGKYIHRVYSKDRTTVFFELTNKGQKLLGGYDLHNIKILAPEKWNGCWSIVVFDIPEKYRYARHFLRGKLKDLGFLRFQQSVWIHPYECENKISFLCDYFSLHRYVLTFRTEIKNDKSLRQYFQRKGYYL